VPALSLGLYLALGSPDVPDAPFAPRIAGPAEELPLDALIVKVEQHLKDEPNDLRGWEVLGPAYLRQGNFAGAVSAWSRAIALGGETASRLAARGEALVFAANGSLTPAARDDFAAAVKLEAEEPRAQYYLGLADIEDGKRDAAIARWTRLLKDAPDDAPWRRSIETELANLKGPGPTAEQAGAAADMTPEARQQMINGMVAGLAARLEKDPDDLGGWLRLIRAYGVLGRTEDAAKAVASARIAFAGDDAALSEIDNAAKALPAQ
jgi:cytochrome c-type biogenesis protein CcmH